MPGVVDDDVDPAGLRDGGVHGLLAGHVEFEGAQVDAVLCGVGAGVGDGRGVAAGGLPDPGVHGVAGVGEGAGGQGAETAGGACDEDGVRHG